MTTSAMHTPALLAPPARPQAPRAEKIVAVARKHGLGPLKQLREMARLRYGPGKISADEYYNLGLFDPAISMPAKQDYVGVTGNWEINLSLSPEPLSGRQTFVADKVMYTALIRQLGFSTTHTQAVLSSSRRFGNIETLADAPALQGFLRKRAQFPLFGKPQSATGSFGSVRIERIEEDRIVLGDGRRVDLGDFCAELVAAYGEGYLLQSAIEQHPALADITGAAVSTLRLVTIRENATPRLFYALWKIPAPGAMSDNFWQAGSMIAPVDGETGTAGQAWAGTGLDAQTVDQHPVSGLALQGTVLPFFHEARRMACEAHALFPEFGVVGWDIAITEHGPLIIECNDNPHHGLYQLAYRQGIRNPEFRPVLERTAAFSRQIRTEQDARLKAREAARRR